MGEKHSMMSNEENEQRDLLTRVFNRRKFSVDLESAMRDARQITYILADLDRFKDVNDTYGHEVGDRMLRNVAKVFAAKCAATRNSFGPYRQGGEAFCVLLTDVDTGKAMEFAESLRAGVEEFRLDSYPKLRVTARVAVVTGPVDRHDNGEVLQAKAHSAVYCHPEHKKRNGVVHVA
jgi:two-component system cell cycle response regulator